MKRLLEITVCPREPGTVLLPVERGGAGSGWTPAPSPGIWSA